MASRCAKCLDIKVPVQLGSTTFVCYSCDFNQLVGYPKCPACDKLMIPTRKDPTKLKCYWLEQETFDKTCRCARCGINMQTLVDSNEMIVCERCVEQMKDEDDV